MNFAQKLIAAKIELTYGTDSTPAGANAILTRNLNITPLVADKKDRNLDSGFLGNKASEQSNFRGKRDYEVELAGAGAAGTAPSFGPLLRACGFSETITALTDVKYAPVSAGFESVSEYYDGDGDLYTVIGERGNVTFNLNSGEYPFMKFDMTGIYVPPATGTIVAPDFSGFKKPLSINNANTTAASFLGYAVKLKSLSLDMANVVIYRNLVGQEAVLLTDRKPSGTIVIEAPTLAQKDYFSSVTANTTGALAVTHGLLAGEIIQFDAPKVEIDPPTFSNDEGILMMSISFRALPTLGDDEVTLTVK